MHSGKATFHVEAELRLHEFHSRSVLILAFEGSGVSASEFNARKTSARNQFVVTVRAKNVCSALRHGEQK